MCSASSGANLDSGREVCGKRTRADGGVAKPRAGDLRSADGVLIAWGSMVSFSRRSAYSAVCVGEVQGEGGKLPRQCMYP